MHTAPPRIIVKPAPASAAKDAAIKRLAHELAVARAQAAADRRRLRRLETALAAARANPHTVAVTPAKLVAALRTGRVYAIDGAVAGEPWHLTIVQPHDGERALIYSGTPHAPSGETYRTWVVRHGRTFDAGELPAATPTTLEMPMALQAGDVVAFSVEPIGAGALPTTPFLMQLKITQ